ncbi:hypothetical protein OOZ54_12465 [Rhodopseudomonas palustris]|uniref:hypothetical protein n=1 Tax=Rhodopseudomonas palustris TaxID=1076 RepID=UPI0022F01826|nr:hypothetical protein [Rhodopseudomonas palustris]WBU27507.1 hypothetical protein OOZ54_12465 [Rhodopseudomonas palustris]
MTEERIERSLVLLAHVIEMDGEAYVPLFDRLEEELRARRRRRDSMSRARQIVESYTLGGGVKAIR